VLVISGGSSESAHFASVAAIGDHGDMIKRLVWVGVVVLCACGGDSSSADTQTEQVNNSCPSQPSLLKGTKSSGDACSGAADCAPTCCSCASGGKTFLGVACVNGKCGDACANITPGSLCN
jgi:hypothetical protein